MKSSEIRKKVLKKFNLSKNFDYFFHFINLFSSKLNFKIRLLFNFQIVPI